MYTRSVFHLNTAEQYLLKENNNGVGLVAAGGAISVLF